MIRMILGVAVISMAFGGTSAVAKIHNPNSELKVEIIAAIHGPTGCAAMVEYDDGAYVQAFITDPLCLPYGITKRFIPAAERDFFPIDPVQAAITDR